MRSPRPGPRDPPPRPVFGQADGRPRITKVRSKVTDIMAQVGVIVAAVLFVSAMTWAMATLPGVHGAIR